MGRISKQRVHEALDRIAGIILEAAGPDGIVSRRDIWEKVKSLSGLEQKLTEHFYRFMDHRDYRPGARITRRDVEDTLAYSKEKLIDDYDRNQNGLSEDEISRMSLLGQYAVEYALQSGHNPGLPEEELIESLKALAEGLFFFAFGSEADEPLHPFFQEAGLTRLNEITFAEALGLNQDDPAQLIERYVEDPSEFHDRFQDQHLRFNPSLGRKAVQLVQLLDQELSEVRIFILGQDDWRLYPRADHPTYWVGLSRKGHILGLRTQVIWT